MVVVVPVAPGCVAAPPVVLVVVFAGVVDCPDFDLPAGPPAWWPLLRFGPVGEWDFRLVPAPFCLCPPVAGAGGVPTVIGIEATPPPPAVSVTCTVTLNWPWLRNVTCGLPDVELGAAPSKLQLYDSPPSS